MTSASSPTLLVLAAGMGSRYGGLKQIDPVGPAGETIIDYSIFDALRAGFGKLVFVIRKDIEEAFRETVGARFEKRVAVEYVFQSLEDHSAALHGSRRAHQAVGHHACHPCRRRDGPRAVRRHQCRRLLRSRELSRARQSSHLRLCRTTPWSVSSCATRFPISEPWRAACARLADGDYLKSIVEYSPSSATATAIENTDAAGQVTRLTGDEPVSHEFLGLHSARLRPVAREL